MGEFSASHWLILLLVVVVLFGSRRLPEAARALGRSMRILKAETRGLRDDDQQALPAAPVAGSATTPGVPDPMGEAYATHRTYSSPDGR
jgi:sec-independent protein translocase protein TatA